MVWKRRSTLCVFKKSSKLQGRRCLEITKEHYLQSHTVFSLSAAQDFVVNGRGGGGRIWTSEKLKYNIFIKVSLLIQGRVVTSMSIKSTNNLRVLVVSDFSKLPWGPRDQRLP